MTVVVTRNAPDRTRGFLASCMCEIAPGVYTAPKMTAGVRDRVWAVVSDWFAGEHEQGIVMTWADRSLPGGQAVRTLGSPQVDLVDRDGIYLARRAPAPTATGSLTTEESETITIDRGE